MKRTSTDAHARLLGKWTTALVLGIAACGAAQAQTKAAQVRSVDEPARVPYSATLSPVCSFSNQCFAEYPAVPAGKRLRLTAMSAFVQSNTNTFPHLLALHRSNSDPSSIVYLVNMPIINAGYYAAVASTNQQLDFIFEAAEKPVLELGVAAGAGGITASSAHLTLTGYLVDTAP